MRELSTPDGHDWISTADAAMIACVSTATVRRWARSGLIPYVERQGGKICRLFVREGDVRHLLKVHERPRNRIKAVS
jgi:predicted site-specific integrase-resolvase